jgi:hypothetical protein
MMSSVARCVKVALLVLVGCASPPPDEDPVGTPDNVDESKLEWRRARLTNFESYPAEGSDECVEFSGCDYEGDFAALRTKQSKEWVMMHNIAAVHSDVFQEYKLKTLRLKNDRGHKIDVTVYDACADEDCDGCCTRNAAETGFLIDLEIYTADRFGMHDGIVDWACLDCDD